MTAIEVEDLSKMYQLGQFSTGTLAQDIKRWWALKRGKEDPFLKIGEENDRSIKGNSEFAWSLKDINFSVEQGTAVAIIGKNGAGKSTLLKILSQITSPTTGSVKVRGRIASLLEVGTGFHPELTGKENIFLNGAILGMRKQEIKRKLDDIIDFSGVSRYIDTPVKRYSSGMYVRLAFSVAAHLESEILVVDEVLAVGDAEFQKQCLGKMNEVSNEQGRTILFVSHNMTAVERLCSKTILLKNGRVSENGLTKDVVTTYLTSENELSIAERELEAKKNTAVTFTRFSFSNDTGKTNNQFEMHENILLKLDFEVKNSINNLEISLGLTNAMGAHVMFTNLSDSNNFVQHNFEPGKYSTMVEIPGNFLIPGIYKVRISAHITGLEDIDTREDVANIKILPGIVNRSYGWSSVLSNSKWRLDKEGR